MPESLITRAKKAWAVFQNPEHNPVRFDPMEYGHFLRPDRTTLRSGTERSIVNSIFTRIAIDVAALTFQHVMVDADERFSGVVDDSLNRCFNLHANQDQTGRQFIEDAVLTLCDEGCIALVPTVTDKDPLISPYNIEELRVGKIIEWFPTKVKVSIYNDLIGERREMIFDKKYVAIIENPLYPIMNEPNSTLRRLIRKLNLLDVVDEQSGSGKLDIIVQLPYAIRNDKKRQEAEIRRKDIEMQLHGSKYGIAYIDATEHVTQLNRPAENNLMGQVTYLTNSVFNQLGISEKVFDGTANEVEMLNYYNKTIEPMAAAIVDACNWKFISQTARTQGHRFMVFRDPFRLVPVSQLAEIADKLTRNEILSSNEFRSILSYKPVKNDPKADQLINSNINQSPSTILKDDPNLIEK